MSDGDPSVGAGPAPILSWQVAGFRSLRGPESLEASPGLNAIFGPEGCGRSSLLESIAWATAVVMESYGVSRTIPMELRG